MTEIKTVQLHEETYNELLKHKDEKQSFDDVLRGLLEMPSSIDLDKQIEDRIKQRKADRQRWDQKNLQEAEELKKREHFFEKFIGRKPSWMWKPGVTKIVFDGNAVTFSRKGCQPLTIEGIKECDISADNYGLKRDESAPFDITTKYSVNYSWSTCQHSGEETIYYEGTKMSVRISTPEYLEEEEQQEDKMREELGC